MKHKLGAKGRRQQAADPLSSNLLFSIAPYPDLAPSSLTSLNILM